MTPEEREAEGQKITLKDKYELLIKARNFHYENFNKWMTYFYVAMSSLFIGYYTIATSKENNLPDKKMLEVIVLMLGYTVSMLLYWSCKGYYFWNINFITLVNYYENDLFKWQKEERVYSVFANKNTQNHYLSPLSGANISTSKLAIIFAFIITLFWGFLLIYFFIPEMPCLVKIPCFKTFFAFLNISFSIIATTLISLILSDKIPKKYLYSKIDHMPDLKIDQKVWED